MYALIIQPKNNNEHKCQNLEFFSISFIGINLFSVMLISDLLSLVTLGRHAIPIRHTTKYNSAFQRMLAGILSETSAPKYFWSASPWLSTSVAERLSGLAI